MMRESPIKNSKSPIFIIVFVTSGDGVIIPIFFIGLFLSNRELLKWNAFPALSLSTAKIIALKSLIIRFRVHCLSLQ